MNNKQLTKERAIQLHRRLWKWIYLKTLKEKRKVEKKEFPFYNIMSVRSGCFLCEYIKNRKMPCFYCLINWKYGRYKKILKDNCMNSYYNDWKETKSWRKAAKLAKIISELPERKEGE